MKSKFEKYLTEMSPPYLHNSEMMSLKSLSTISKEQMERAWNKIVNFGENEYLLQRKNKTAFILGVLEENTFYQYVQVFLTLPRVGSPQTKHSYQVEMVNVSRGKEDSGFTRKAYIEIAKHYTLISDSEQYQASKKLWQSVAKSDEVYVYVYDGMIKDYLRDSEKNIIKYNGKNIDENEIWGKNTKHISRVLVASMKGIE
jgi:hypothetical protein